MPDVRLLERRDGRAASRAHLLVLPSVVCANAVVTGIGSAVPGAATVVHQHGCGQVGDDAGGTTAALERLAGHPNAWATLIVSLGCETLQGRALHRRLRARGVDCTFVSIQECGGSAAAVRAGTRLLSASAPPAALPRVSSPAARVGIAFVGDAGALAAKYASGLRAAGLEVQGPLDASRTPVLALTEATTEHGLLALVLVADRGLPLAPVLTPVLSVAASHEHFARTEGAFDLVLPNLEELTETLADTLSGRRAGADGGGSGQFAIRRTAVSL